eukprot:421118-Prymnesium_polylepis.1
MAVSRQSLTFTAVSQGGVSHRERGAHLGGGGGGVGRFGSDAAARIARHALHGSRGRQWSGLLSSVRGRSRSSWPHFCKQHPLPTHTEGV